MPPRSIPPICMLSRWRPWSVRRSLVAGDAVVLEQLGHARGADHAEQDQVVDVDEVAERRDDDGERGGTLRGRHGRVINRCDEARSNRGGGSGDRGVRARPCGGAACLGQGVPDAATWKNYSKTRRAPTSSASSSSTSRPTTSTSSTSTCSTSTRTSSSACCSSRRGPRDNIRDYNKNYERVKPKFILGYLTHHLKVDKWTLLVLGGRQDRPRRRDARRRSGSTQTFFQKSMPFRPDSPMQQKVALEVAKKGLQDDHERRDLQGRRVPGVHQGQARSASSRSLPVGTPYESLTFDRHDIVLLQESYPDITPVAGILATQFSTPLSHVNLRAGAWGIPNAGDKKARDKYGKLDGKVVYYEVTDTGDDAARGDRRGDQGARGPDRGGQARRPARRRTSTTSGSRC